MKSKIRRILNVDIKHYVSLLLIVISFNFAEFVYQLSYERLIINLIDFWRAIKSFFKMIYYGTVATEVEMLPAELFDPSRIIKMDFDYLKEKFVACSKIIFTYENMYNYYKVLILIFMLIMMLVCVGVMIYVFSKQFIDMKYLSPSDEYEPKDSKILAFFKRFIEPIIIGGYKAVLSYKRFLKEHKGYVFALVLIWLLNFNIISFVLCLLTLYICLVSMVNVFASFDMIFKFFIELFVTLVYTPICVYPSTFLFVYLSLRKMYALNFLRHNERKNRGVINEQPLAVLNVGTMGAKKTTTAVDMALSTSAMFRDKAREILFKYEMKFPNFPWLVYERELKKCFDNHTIFNLASCKVYVQKKQEEFTKAKTNKEAKEILYGYDFEKYRMEYDNKLEIVDIFDVLETYAKAYLIYTIEGSLILANMSVREDFMFDGSEFFPHIYSDFFSKPSYDKFSQVREGEEPTSKFARVFDYEMFRLGKKMIKENRNSNAFEFGVILLTELGKERKNTLENRELKKKSDEANQNNDLFNTRLKMLRHAATVDYYCFARMFCDEQRPESLGADARDLCSVIDVSDCSELKLAYNGLLISRLFHDRVYPSLRSFLQTVRNLRGDNTLLVYILKNFLSKIEDAYENTQNFYGYFVVRCNVAARGKTKKYRYYLAKKKIHSGKFATDTHASVFENMALSSNKGFKDFISYKSLRQTEEELAAQNSYFYNEMKEWKEG